MAEQQTRSEELLEELVRVLVAERVESGAVDIETMTFAEMEQISHGLGRELSRRLQGSFVSDQGGRMPPDYDCPTCGLECEAVRTKRTIKTVDGLAEIEELKSYCPKCRRCFFPSS